MTKLRYKHEWTPEEDELLRELWLDRAAYPRLTIRGVAARLNRTVRAVYYRASVTNLLGAPPGMESIRAAAKRTGYSSSALVEILKRLKIKTYTVLTLETPGRRFVKRFIPVEETDRAIREWMDKESVRGAAKRLGIDYNRLRGRLKAEGHMPPVSTPGGICMIPGRIIAKVIRDFAEEDRFLTLDEAARRLGTTRFVLARALAEAGIRPLHNREKRFRTVELNEATLAAVDALRRRLKRD